MTRKFLPPGLSSSGRLLAWCRKMAEFLKFITYHSPGRFPKIALSVRGGEILWGFVLCFMLVLGVHLPIWAKAAKLDDLDNLENGRLQNLLANETELDLFCLQTSYPQIEKVEFVAGEPWLFLKNGQKIPYNTLSGGGNFNNASIRESMTQIYPLEPQRPDFLPEMAPGRKRSQMFMEALYGRDSREVAKNLVSIKYLGKYIRLSPDAARAFAQIAPQLEKWRASEQNLRPWLTPEGGFYWRNIAGENRLSPHAFGIALDIGVKAAPYWRWAKINPHPKQKSYPSEIVRLFEDHGFIWGGKWHEYDLMHFEYRPELICKAKILGKR